uniref:Uncharacterized protein n=1 Tax=Rhizophora mucronata TaxID=61149 RepID=A0A2P2N126_RHIMU
MNLRINTTIQKFKLIRLDGIDCNGQPVLIGQQG